MMSLQRIAAPITNAFFITACLFYLMQYLVYVEEPSLGSIKIFPIPEITIGPEEETVRQIIVKPIKPIIPKELPKLPINENVIIKKHNISTEFITYKHPIGGKLIQLNDSQLIVVLSYPPTYPNNALSRNIEGYAVVGFSVSASGATFDPFIIESEPGTTFDRTSLKAILKFKYKAKTVNGKPVIASNQRYLFTYEIDKES